MELDVSFEKAKQNSFEKNISCQEVGIVVQVSQGNTMFGTLDMEHIINF
jgi:hypothetical protein